MKKIPLIKGFSKSASLWTWSGKTGRESLLLVVGGVTTIQLVLGHFESFINFSTTERFKYLLSTAMKIHIMGRIVKKQIKFVFSSLVT